MGLKFGRQGGKVLILGARHPENEALVFQDQPPDSMNVVTEGDGKELKHSYSKSAEYCRQFGIREAPYPLVILGSCITDGLRSHFQKPRPLA